MDLTLQDKNELLKAAVRSTDREIGIWLASVVETFDERPEGRGSVPCPPFRSNGKHPEAPELR